METNVILKYRRPSDCWLCPECDSENPTSAKRCQVCNCARPIGAALLKAWKPSDEITAIPKTTPPPAPRGPMGSTVPPPGRPFPPGPGAPPPPPPKSSSATGVVWGIIIGIVILIFFFIYAASNDLFALVPNFRPELAPTYAMALPAMLSVDSQESYDLTLYQEETIPERQANYL